MKSKASHKIIFNEDLNKLECSLYKVDIPPPDEALKLNDFYELWNSKRKNTALPAWKDFFFEDFKGWHSYMRVMTLGNDIKDIKKNIIAGEKFTRYWGKKTIYEQIQEGTPPSKKTIKQYYEYLSYIYDHHYGFNDGSIPKKDGALSSALWIELPLADNGKDVTHILSAIIGKV